MMEIPAYAGMTYPTINIIGAGLAGCEAAYQAARRGVRVRLFEMKPAQRSPAHKLDTFAELVCSNSLRSNDPANAAGLLKEEMRLLGSLTIEAADATAVPAGKALAVDRKKFSEYITEKIHNHQNIEIISKEITSLDEVCEVCHPRAGGDPLSIGDPRLRGDDRMQDDKTTATIIATGPLTSDKLSSAIKDLIGQEYLYFYDSVAPIVSIDSLDLSKGFKASRYGYGGDDYWNFQLTKEQYEEFLLDLAGAEKVVPHEFEDQVYFEGCLPIEVMAGRGPEVLRYGPMKPFGIRDPQTGVEPYAVIQLRAENADMTMFNIVGFQTRMKHDEQKRIFRKIPGFKKAEFLRLGLIHRNTYINSPKVLDENLCLRHPESAGFFGRTSLRMTSSVSHPEQSEGSSKCNLMFSGQITGVEGYIESAATGIWSGLFAAKKMMGQKISPPPHTTAIGSLIWHAANPNHRHFEPMNINFGLMPILKGKIRRKDRKGLMADRARADMKMWLENENRC